jgi:hypothetical protein
VQPPRPDEPSSRRILQILAQHEVAFIVIGAVAAIAQGYPLQTQDLDITPRVDPQNLERFAAALVELDAQLRLPDGSGLPFPIEARMLGQADAWTMTTRFGDLDAVFVPAGTRGYDDLRRDAVELDFGDGLRVLVASIADVIRSKEAAGRVKDQAQLPALRQTLELIREREARSKRG